MSAFDEPPPAPPPEPVAAPGPAGKLPPPLPPAERVRIATRAVTAMLLPLAVVAPLAVVLLAKDRAAALGLALGHATALVTGLTWIVAAVRWWDASGQALLKATLGLWPARLLLLLGAIGGGAALQADMTWTGGAFLLTLVHGHVVEGWCLGALADATRRARAADASG